MNLQSLKVYAERKNSGTFATFRLIIMDKFKTGGKTVFGIKTLIFFFSQVLFESFFVPLVHPELNCDSVRNARRYSRVSFTSVQF